MDSTVDAQDQEFSSHPRWFRLRPGLSGVAERITHCADLSFEGERLGSWCRRNFRLCDVEEVAEPGVTPQPGQARAGVPCTACLMLVACNAEVSEPEPELVATPNQAGQEPSTTDTYGPMPLPRPALSAPDRSLVVMLQGAQTLLAGMAAEAIPSGTMSERQHHDVADILDHLAQLLRERAEASFEPAA